MSENRILRLKPFGTHRFGAQTYSIQCFSSIACHSNVERASNANLFLAIAAACAPPTGPRNDGESGVNCLLI